MRGEVGLVWTGCCRKTNTSSRSFRAGIGHLLCFFLCIAISASVKGGCAVNPPGLVWRQHKRGNIRSLTSHLSSREASCFVPAPVACVFDQNCMTS